MFVREHTQKIFPKKHTHEVFIGAEASVVDADADWAVPGHDVGKHGREFVVLV